MTIDTIPPPYPWFGGKSSVAEIIWQRFGDCRNYVEPFFGGGAVWRLRPHWPFDDSVIRRETINDYDGHVANFWRATQADPDAVAKWLDWPVNEIDLKARGDWLFCRPESREFVEAMRADPELCCAKTAGWWCWFVSNWIGALPSVNGGNHQNDDGVHNKRPHLGNAGTGVSRQLPHIGDAGRGECERTSESLRHWMRQLADRLRRVRVCCGDWSRVAGPSVTYKNATPCAVFLDPPYSAEAGRDNALYSEESATVAHDVREWCLAEGANVGMRICLAGYEGEGHEALEAAGWDVVAWKASGGYANQGEGGRGKAGANGRGVNNCNRERLWFSPGCLRPGGQPALFD